MEWRRKKTGGRYVACVQQIHVYQRPGANCSNKTLCNTHTHTHTLCNTHTHTHPMQHTSRLCRNAMKSNTFFIFTSSFNASPYKHTQIFQAGRAREQPQQTIQQTNSQIQSMPDVSGCIAIPSEPSVIASCTLSGIDQWSGEPCVHVFRRCEFGPETLIRARPLAWGRP